MYLHLGLYANMRDPITVYTLLQTRVTGLHKTYSPLRDVKMGV
jgi:hypothetical protein